MLEEVANSGQSNMLNKYKKTKDKIKNIKKNQ